MILFDIAQDDESHPIYQEMAVANGDRQYHFLGSLISASLQIGRPLLSATILKALNFQAIACLHSSAGEYRPCQVEVRGVFLPPAHYQVSALMEDFVNVVNRRWETTDPIVLAAYVLWRLNYIHPFINGNGRTARAACYFVLCVKYGGWLPGSVILPELIKDNRVEYTAALVAADTAFINSKGTEDLGPLHTLLTRLLKEQKLSAQAPVDPASPASSSPPGDPADPTDSAA